MFFQSFGMISSSISSFPCFPDYTTVIKNKFFDCELFTFADVFNFLKEIEDIRNLRVYSIKEALSDLTHAGTFRRFSNEAGIQFYSTTARLKKSRSEPNTGSSFQADDQMVTKDPSKDMF
jgi:hypothetical protein